MFLLDGKPLALDVAFTHGDIQYPANWLRLASPEERAAIGISEVADPEPYDQRFYWAFDVPKQLDDREESDQDGKPMWVKVYDPDTKSMVDTDKRLVTKGLKAQWIAQVKDTAGKLLAQTDWMVLRKAERNVDIPKDIVTKRTAIVTECDRLENAIKECVDVPSLISVVTNQKWENN